MRQLYILRGLPAAGKSTLVKELGLENETISVDKLRLAYSNPTDELIDGHYAQKINQSISKQAFKTAYELLDMRFKNGQTTFFDATNILQRDIDPLYKLAKKQGYRVTVVNVGQDLDLDRIKYQNSMRPELKQVSDKVIDKFANRLASTQLPKRYVQITDKDLKSALSWKESDISKYKDVLVIGDIHSSATALKSVLGKYSKDRFYVFLGDYFDRGIEPVETLKTLKPYFDKPNAVFIEGNHEIHLRNYLYGNHRTGGVAFKETITELEKAGLVKDVKHLVHQLQPVFLAKFYDKHLVFDHAGLTQEQLDLKDQFVLKNETFFTKGIGAYQFDVDADFAENVKDPSIIQFHGHRNAFLHSPFDFRQSINLEQKVEHGNKLGAVLLTPYKNDITMADVSKDNPVFNHKLNRFDKHSEVFDWFSVKQNPNIRVKDLRNGISVLNFTRKAFQDGNWDAETIKARGLFIDNAQHVVARGYDKFFNLNEQPETQLDVIIDRFARTNFTIAEKKNGFLTIMSYVPQLGGLFITSKGNGEDYSKIAQDIIEATLKRNGKTLQDLSDYLKAQYDKGLRISYTLEAIDPKVDPHIVKYTQPEAVLLDAISNQIDAEYHPELADKLAKEFNFNQPCVEHVKKLAKVPDSKAKVARIIEEIRAVPDQEGAVLTTADGFKVKIKSNFYLRRKELRNRLEAWLGSDESHRQVSRDSLLKRHWSYSESHDVFAEFTQKMIDENDYDKIALSKLGKVDVPRTIEENHLAL